MRYRITVRGDVELRGTADFDNIDTLREFAQAMEPFGLVVASDAEYQERS